MSEPPLSCKYIALAQAKIRRIREWAEVAGPNWIDHLAEEAWNEIEKVRQINRELRKAAYGRATCHSDLSDEEWFALQEDTILAQGPATDWTEE